jgi:hypothetical protein
MISVILLVLMLNKSQLLRKKLQLRLQHRLQLLRLSQQLSQSKDLLTTINKAFVLICSSQ